MRESKSAMLAELSNLYHRSKHFYKNGVMQQEYFDTLDRLSILLKGVEEGVRDLLPFVSRINRNLLLAKHSDLLSAGSVVSRPERPKFVIITAVWKREALTRIFYQYYAQLAQTYAEYFELSMVVAGSEGVGSQRLAEAYGFEYLEVPNDPLSNKWQATAEALKNRDFDAAVIAGSDDFLSASVFMTYRKLYLEGANAVGFVDGHFYNTASNEMIYWKGYGGEKRLLGMPERVGESIGMGRMLSRELLIRINFQVWSGEPINKSLDNRMKQNLAKVGFLHVEYKEMNIGLFNKALPFSIVTLKSGDECMLLDVKYEIHVTDFKKYRNHSEPMDSPFNHIEAHFGQDLANHLRSLSQA